MLLGTLLIRLVYPVLAVGVSVLAQDNQWGLLNQWKLPVELSVVIAVLVLDVAVYAQHVMFHSVPILWRIQRMHHMDTEFDFTTGVRFHPAEIILSMAIKFAVIVVVGAPAVAVLLFEIVLSSSSLFNHANVQLSKRVDKALRWILVAPDMHRIHHSVRVDELNRNFGFTLPW